MLENYVIPAQRVKPYIPEVKLKIDGNFTISGSSYMENAIEFYDGLLDWLEEFMDTRQEVHLKIYLEYLNTSSSKSLNNFLILLDDYYADGVHVKASWYYSEGDTDSLEEGESFQEEVDFPFNLVNIQKQKINEIVT